MFLSIIIPVYNAEKYVVECLDSCLEQDISRDDYEIICVNDGSKDGSLGILRDYERKFDNIRVIDQQNGGVCTARNTGLDHAEGDYVWFVDADDLIAPNILGKFKNIISERNCDRLSFGIYQFSEELTEQEKTARANKETVANADYYDTSSINNIIRRAYMTENDIYFKHPTLRYAEDMVFCFELGIPKVHTFEKIDTVGYYYRNNSVSAMGQIGMDVMKYVDSLSAAAKIYKHYYDNNMGSKKLAANKMMQCIWSCRYWSAGSSEATANEINEKLRENGLLPIRKPAECTVKRSHIPAFEGKLFDFLYTRSHRRVGYFGLSVYFRMKEYSKKLRSIFRRRK